MEHAEVQHPSRRLRRPLQKKQLEKGPRYTQTSMPEYNDDYGRKVYDYYGVTCR